MAAPSPAAAPPPAAAGTASTSGREGRPAYVPQPIVISSWAKGFAGSFGGVAEAVCLQPMDVIKTRLQLDTIGKYKGIYQTGALIIKEEGARSLWKGLTPFATHLTLKYALRMGSNTFYLNLMRDKEGGVTDGKRLLSGLAAGLTEAVVVVTPFEVVKTRLQQQRGMSKEGLRYRGPVHCAATVLREEGLRGMWSGCTPTMLRNGTNQMCLFWAKPTLDRIMYDKHDGDGRILSPVQSMTSGFMAACLGPFATGPFDVAKTRLMAQQKGTIEAKYTGFFDVLMKIPKEEGFMALWRGLLPRLMRIPPGQAIVWAVSDQIVGHFETQAAKKQQEEAGLAQDLLE